MLTEGWLRDNIQRRLRRGSELVTRDVGQICVVCAWRANCKKKFSIGGDVSMHCPDFTRDVSIDKESKEQKVDEETEEN